MFTYAKKDIRGHYLTVDEQLPAEQYENIGTTAEDYDSNLWILLSEGQLAFKEENQKATPKEVINMAITPLTLDQLKQKKMQALSEYYYANYNKIKYGDNNVYLSQSQRSSKRSDINRAKELSQDTVAINEKVSISPDYANQMLDIIEQRDTECQNWMTSKRTEINAAADEDQLEAIVVDSGLPDEKVIADSELESKDNDEAKVSAERQVLKFMYMNLNTLAASVDDATSLSMKMLYPEWGMEGAEMGKQVEPGFKFRHNKKDLYKVMQSHKLQADWIPGQGTESLYERIDETHAGTLEDPIPYSGNMRLELGKYYSQGGKTYKCIRDTGIPVYDDLVTLATVGGGSYVEEV